MGVGWGEGGVIGKEDAIGDNLGSMSGSFFGGGVNIAEEPMSLILNFPASHARELLLLITPI